MNVKIPSYPSIYESVYKLQKIFLVRVFWLKFIFRIKFKIPILDLMLLPKTVFHFKGYTPVTDHDQTDFCIPVSRQC